MKTVNFSNRNVYVISDIHNGFQEFKDMLRMIKFSKGDYMVIIGDIFDRGPNPVDLYLEILKHENICVLKGNHEELHI